MNSNQGSDTHMPISKIITGVREPLYRQLARELERRIATGKLNSGDGPASYRALCEEFGVSMSVVQRAFRELRRDDLVRTQQGRRVELAPDARGGKSPGICSANAIPGACWPSSTKRSIRASGS